MNGNLVRLLDVREKCSAAFKRHEEKWLARQSLQELYDHETMFDHPDLLRLHFNLIHLAVKYHLVAETVIQTVEKWKKEEFECPSEMFLAKHILRFINEDEVELITELCDGIKMFTL